MIVQCVCVCTDIHEGILNVNACMRCVCVCADGSTFTHLRVKQAVLWAGHQNKYVHLHKVGHLGWVDLPNGNSVALGRFGAEAETATVEGRGGEGE